MGPLDTPGGWPERPGTLQRLARTDLLNLHRDFDDWNPPDPKAGEPTPK